MYKGDFYQRFCNGPSSELNEGKCVAQSSWPRNHCSETIWGKLTLSFRVCQRY